MVKVLINGALGKMGKNVKIACEASSTATAVCGVDIREDFSNLDFPVYDNFNSVKEQFDVIIDFSSPKALPAILDYAVKNKTAAVLCATGYTKEDLDKIKAASEKTALFRSANMSLGINLLIELVKKATAMLDGFDIEIIEKHHNQKVDAPSGTALMLADAVKEVKPDDYYVYGRNGNVGKRNAKEIGIHAVRGGTIVGQHDVLFAGANEIVTLSHEATDRSVFAVGAVQAATFLKGKPNGLYNMQNVVSSLQK